MTSQTTSGAGSLRRRMERVPVASRASSIHSGRSSRARAEKPVAGAGVHFSRAANASNSPANMSALLTTGLDTALDVRVSEVVTSCHHVVRRTSKGEQADIVNPASSPRNFMV